MAGLYIHIPFCKQACHYCDFHFSTNTDRVDEMVQAIAREIYLQKDYLQQPQLDSIYLGGGTPSLLSGSQLDQLMRSIHEQFSLAEDSEVTLEANPDDLTATKLEELKSVGVNRLSIGVQSFDDKALRFMNRSHDSVAAMAALANARQAGFNNISLDLIYAVPGQGKRVLEDNIARALDFAPEHISTYSLTIEEKTVFGNWFRKKNLIPVDESVNAEEYELLMNKLTDAGYEHYEISNFGKPGFIARHNTNYWRQEPYLGVGPSAHSYNTTSRQFNVKNNAGYLKAIKLDQVPFEKETLTREEKVNEFILTTLRTQWGCNADQLTNDFEFDLMAEKKKQLQLMIDNNLIGVKQNIITLTSKGKLLADQIAADLMV